MLLLSSALCSTSTADSAPFIFVQAPLRRASFCSEPDSEIGVQYVVFCLWRLNSHVLLLAILSDPALILGVMWETEPDHLCCQSWRGVSKRSWIMLFSCLAVPEEPCDALPPASFIPSTSRMACHRFLCLEQKFLSVGIFASDQPCLTSAACPNYPGQPNNLSMFHLVNRGFSVKDHGQIQRRVTGSSKHRRRGREPFIAK